MPFPAARPKPARWTSVAGKRPPAAARPKPKGPKGPKPSEPAAAALWQAEAEGLELVRSGLSNTGFKGVYKETTKGTFFVQVYRPGGSTVSLGVFETAEEGALAYARHRTRARPGPKGPRMPKGTYAVGRLMGRERGAGGVQRGRAGRD